MPRATAIWLIDNTALSFEQIADFCQLHELEVKAIADGEVAQHIEPLDPIATKQLTAEEIKRCTDDPDARLQLRISIADQIPDKPKTRTRKYTPIASRQNKPNAIFWLLKVHPELSDKQIVRLIGTTHTMILSIRERTHWNIKNLRPQDPVLLGICSQIELDDAIANANENAAI